MLGLKLIYVCKRAQLSQTKYGTICNVKQYNQIGIFENDTEFTLNKKVYSQCIISYNQSSHTMIPYDAKLPSDMMLFLMRDHLISNNGITARMYQVDQSMIIIDSWADQRIMLTWYEAKLNVSF